MTTVLSPAPIGPLSLFPGLSLVDVQCCTVENVPPTCRHSESVLRVSVVKLISQDEHDYTMQSVADKILSDK